MKFKWTSSNRFMIKFLVSLLVIGIIVGFIFYYRETTFTKSNIDGELALLKDFLHQTKQNNFFYHIILLSVLMVLSLIIIGLPLILFYLFYEGVCFGFLLASLFHYKSVNGLFFGLISGLVNKSVIILALSYIIIANIRYNKKMLISIKNKDYHLYEHVTNHLFKFGFMFIIIVISDVFIYYFGNKILAYFLFLL